MHYRIGGLARAAAAAGFLTTAGLGSAMAQAPSSSPGQGGPAPASAGAASPAARAGSIATSAPRVPAISVESRITDLEKRLGITAAERSQFTAMAKIMRANAKMMDALLAERQSETIRSAVDSLRWYQRLTETHAEALGKFVPAFDALYAVLSANQRKTADALFQQFGQPPRPSQPR